MDNPKTQLIKRSKIAAALKIHWSSSKAKQTMYMYCIYVYPSQKKQNSSLFFCHAALLAVVLTGGTMGKPSSVVVVVHSHAASLAHTRRPLSLGLSVRKQAKFAAASFCTVHSGFHSTKLREVSHWWKGEKKEETTTLIFLFYIIIRHVKVCFLSKERNRDEREVHPISHSTLAHLPLILRHCMRI